MWFDAPESWYQIEERGLFLPETPNAKNELTIEEGAAQHEVYWVVTSESKRARLWRHCSINNRGSCRCCNIRFKESGSDVITTFSNDIAWHFCSNYRTSVCTAGQSSQHFCNYNTAPYSYHKLEVFLWQSTQQYNSQWVVAPNGLLLRNDVFFSQSSFRHVSKDGKCILLISPDIPTAISLETGPDD